MTFICTGKQCLKCPLKDCIRDMCEVDGEFVNVVVKKEKLTQSEYWANYYANNRDRILAKKKAEYRRRVG